MLHQVCLRVVEVLEPAKVLHLGLVLLDELLHVLLALLLTHGRGVAPLFLLVHQRLAKALLRDGVYVPRLELRK